MSNGEAFDAMPEDAARDDESEAGAQQDGRGEQSESPPFPRLGAGVNAGGREQGPVRPVNWDLLSSDQAEIAWLELNSWVSWLRLTYGLTPSVLPPCWHRHPELTLELSALHTHWLGAYDPEQHASGPLIWHRDFAETCRRLRDWVQASGTRLDRDRPTRQTRWPGEEPFPTIIEEVIDDRDLDFVQYVMADVAARRAEEEDYYQRQAEQVVDDE